MIELVDTHAHIDVDEFEPDRAQVVARARSAGVSHQIVPAIDAAGWARLEQVCSTLPGLHPAYGLHPMFLHAHRDEHVVALRARVAARRPVAIGECGLDHFVEGLDPARQQVLFDAQLRLARDFDLPVIIHARRAVDAVIASIRRVGGLRGVVHSFSGSRQQAEVLWRQGFAIGVGGPVTYERAARLRALAADMPVEHLLLETDSPDQPDARRRGLRNEPSRLVHVLECIATLRGESPVDLASATTGNAVRMFGLSVAAESSIGRS